MARKKNKYIKDVQRDAPDARDYIYEPSLIRLDSKRIPPGNLIIRDQKNEGACTGFALAAVINRLNQERDQGIEVSPRMLYEMAKRFDEWPGESYEGSSVRAAISGWKNMGVCLEDDWPYRTSRKGMLTIDAARKARSNTVGAYYRVRPIISHFHCALNEAGVILASAQVHKGWDAPPATGKIKYFKTQEGGHAFAIVGYDETGFWIQNSWGKDWGKRGLGHWLYEDWIQNIMDAWVVRLALPTPEIFDKQPASSKLYSGLSIEEAKKPSTPRADIAGHFVHIDDGMFHDEGNYWSNAADIEQTAEFISKNSKYDHLLIHAHGGLNAPKASAARILAMKEGFKRNRIYPFHIMYDTGLAEELKDLVSRKGTAARERVGAAFDLTDRFLEGILRVPGTLLWNEIKTDAFDAFDTKGAGREALQLFIKHFRKAATAGVRKKIHLVGHSTGGILIAHLLRALQNTDLEITSCSLLAPACTLDLFHSHYLPVLQGKRSLKLRDLRVYTLEDRVERDDNVALAYRKSLLYLVSRSLEPRPPEGKKLSAPDKEKARGQPLLGMELYESDVRKFGGKPVFHKSNGATGAITRSNSHSGFDNDPVTMNHILTTVLGERPKKPFTNAELSRF